MAINVSFNGATIYLPGAYSQELIDLSGGFPLSPTGLVAIFGESTSGTPGAQVQNIANNVYSPDQMTLIQQTYGTGPLVDACNFLFAPGADGAIPGGAQAVYIYKTNASTQANLDPVASDNGAAAYGSLQARAYGVGGNQITFKNALIPETPATASGNALTFPIVITSSNNVLTYALNGTASATATIAASSYANMGTLVAAINSALGASTLVASAGAGSSLAITQAAGTNLQANGWGRSFEIIAGGTDDASSVLGLTTVAGTLVIPSSETEAVITVANPVSTLVESGTVGGTVVMSLGRAATGSATSASVSFNGTTLTLSQTGVVPTSYALPVANFPSIASAVAYINTLPGWNASTPSTQTGLMSMTIMDTVSGVGALYSGSTPLQPARIKNDAMQVANFFAASTQVTLMPSTVDSSPVQTVGLPDQQGVPNALYLIGGTLGGTSTAEITNALTQFQSIRVNSVIPLFSRDATKDITDQLTDPTSNYTIAGIHQAVKTHLSLTATTKEKSERQGYLSIHDTYNNCKAAISTMADARVQMTIQDVLQNNSLGAQTWFLPWAGACMLAGARGGTPVGTPMTFKYFNMSGIRQTGQLLSTPPQNIVLDFNPATQYDDAIQNGVTFWQAPQTGGFRLAVDNTTYLTDGNWVYNRASVLYAADVLAYDFRNQLENIYVGVKNNVGASEIKNTCESILSSYLAQGITVSTSDAKNGYKSLVVQINGNTVNISVTVKLVEGIDFVLATISLQRASQTA